MEKNILTFILIVALFAAICMFPVFKSNAQAIYVVCKDDVVADRVLSYKQKWHASDYYVYVCDEKPKAIPFSLTVREYCFTSPSILKMNNGFMQVYESGSKIICGIPYIID